jgi:glycosyltransferase involved in cell wall biosynthesis
MNKPLITVITTTYYRPDFLERCILAVQNQTLQNYEHYIFADHCPYAKFIYDKYKDDKRITFIENDKPHIKNVGAVGKRHGIENAKSDIICYCDDDNVLLPNHLETIYNNIEQHDCIFTKFYHIDKKKGKNFSFIEWLKSDMYDREDYNDIGNYDMLVCGHKKNIITKHANWVPVAENGGNHNEDGILMREWKSSGVDIKYLNDITAIYNAHGGCVENETYDTALQNYRNYLSIKYGTIE